MCRGDAERHAELTQEAQRLQPWAIYSVEFSGSAAAWVALISYLVALAAALAALAYDFWGTDAKRP